MKAKKKLTFIFFAEKSKNHKKIFYHRKVGMLIVKVKKFGVDWYIPYEMAADSAKGGLIGLTMPSNVLLLRLKQTFPPIIWIFTEGEGDGIKSGLSS